MAFEFARPLKSWRPFAGEVGTIVLGVLIALGAQELMQSLHWQREVRETRKALDAELARDLAAFDYRMSQRKCVQDRLTELNRWAQSYRTGTPVKLKAPIPSLPGFTIRTAVWELTDGEIAARIPLQAKLNYAWLYDALTTFEEITELEAEAWEKIAEYEDSSRLEEAELRVLKRALANAEGVNTVLQAFEPNIDKFADELNIRPEENIEGRAHRLLAEWNRELCRPLL